MSWLDATILVLLALGATLGALTGAFWQVARVTMVSAGAVASLRWGGWAAGILENRFNPAVAAIFGYAAMFLLVYLAAFAVCSVIDQGLKLSDLKWLDRVLGAALGAAKATAILLIALAALSMYPTPEFSRDLQDSILGRGMLRGAEEALPVEGKARVRWLLDRAQKAIDPLCGEPTEAPRALAEAFAPEPKTIPAATRAGR